MPKVIPNIRYAICQDRTELWSWFCAYDQASIGTATFDLVILDSLSASILSFAPKIFCKTEKMYETFLFFLRLLSQVLSFFIFIPKQGCILVFP